MTSSVGSATRVSLRRGRASGPPCRAAGSKASTRVVRTARGSTGSGASGKTGSISRNSSRAVEPTSPAAWAALTPGIWALMRSPPTIVTSASETPKPLTRSSMMIRACSISSLRSRSGSSGRMTVLIVSARGRSCSAASRRSRSGLRSSRVARGTSWRAAKSLSDSPSRTGAADPAASRVTETPPARSRPRRNSLRSKPATLSPAPLGQGMKPGRYLPGLPGQVTTMQNVATARITNSAIWF